MTDDEHDLQLRLREPIEPTPEGVKRATAAMEDAAMVLSREPRTRPRWVDMGALRCGLVGHLESMAGESAAQAEDLKAVAAGIDDLQDAVLQLVGHVAHLHAHVMGTPPPELGNKTATLMVARAMASCREQTPNEPR